MANFSASCLARSFQELLGKSSEEANTDFTVICGEKEIPVHSLVLASRSPVFRAAVTGNFTEKKDKRIYIQGFSSKAVEEVVRFLYGFEIHEGFEEVEELIALGEMYQIDDLKTAAAMIIDKNISKERVFTIAEVAAKHNADEAFDKCVEFIVNNFEIQDLIQNGMLDQFPKIAVSILKKRPSAEPKSVLRVYSGLHPTYAFDYRKSQTHSLQFITYTDIVLTGIGLFVCPENKGELTADITLTDLRTGRSPIISSATLKNSDPDRNIVRVSIQPTKLTAQHYYKIQVIMTGPGFSAAGTGGVKEVVAD
eukprot:GFUD01009803.1.p1 GENE.GFUD01009803.1~~GFUD01009803.1.p1  ORF type:complete len:309 (-),score=61.73 GFUD01009803.1:238-1164(-)